MIISNISFIVRKLYIGTKTMFYNLRKKCKLLVYEVVIKFINQYIWRYPRSIHEIHEYIFDNGQ